MDSDTETESATCKSSWDKMKDSVHKIGFVEGLTSGKEASFQSGFDQGYAEGFKSGHTLGKINGVLRTLQDIYKDDDDETARVVRHTNLEPDCRRGLCLLCNTKNTVLSTASGVLDEDCDDKSFKVSVESQMLTVQRAVDAHLDQMKNIYLSFNIGLPQRSSHLVNKAVI